MKILVFEPRLEGHHLSWLRYITEDFLSAGHQLTLAIDGRESAAALYREQLADLWKSVFTISVYADERRFKGGTRIAALSACLTESGAEQAFANNLDDIASSMLRRAALGLYPPMVLKGKISGVYFRPRFLANSYWPVGNLIKKAGFDRLISRGWFHKICLVDEYLHQKHSERYPHHVLTFLPDTWSGTFSMDKMQARRSLGIGSEKFVFLHYGIGTRRKGLHLLLRAMQSHTSAHWHLLCAGRIAQDPEILNRIQQLTNQGRATVLNRYVSKEEEQACFTATDVVVLPYVRHFGSSGVLALAAAARKMVVASDEGLIAQRVKQKGLGLCFPSENIVELGNALIRSEEILRTDTTAFAKRAAVFARECDRGSFGKVMQSIYPVDNGL